MDLKNLSEAAEPAAPVAPANKPGAAPQPERVENPYEPMVHGESTYDRVTSMLISLVIGTSIIVGFLFLMTSTMVAYSKPTPSKVEIIEVSGEGGDLSGEIGGGESVEVAGAQEGGAASNTQEQSAADMNEPAEMAVQSSQALDALSDQADGGEMAEVSSESSSVGTGVASGPRRSRKGGKGGLALGIGGGPGTGGVAREKRWVIDFPPGQSEEDYAKQLDSLGIELGTFASATTVVYGSNFSSAPVRRTGLSKAEDRWYLTWRGQGRKAFDIALLRRAGIDVGPNGVILQFYPKKVEERLARMEYDFKGRQPAEIRRTRFKVIPAGGRYDFQVSSQETLRPQ